MVRKVINFKQLAVTPLKIEIPRIAKKKVLSAAWKEAGEFYVSALDGAPPPALAREQETKNESTRRRLITRAPLLSVQPKTPKTTDVEGKFASSAWGKKLAARSAKAAMTDLDRYKAKAAKGKAGKAKPAAAAAAPKGKALAAKAK